MLTKDERGVLFIAAMKEGLDEFLRRIGLEEREFWELVKGKYNPQLELRLRENWHKVLAVLDGRNSKRGDK